MGEIMRQAAAGSLSAYRSSARPAGELADSLAFRVGSIAQVAVDRVGDDAPLRTRGDQADRLELRLHVAGDAHAQLRIILHPLARARARRRAPDAATFLGCTFGTHLV